MTSDLQNDESNLAYASPQYAKSFFEFGEVYELKKSGGYLLVRTIPGTTSKDATSCYPWFSCRDWSLLPTDISNVTSDIVSIVLVTDPFADLNISDMRNTFDQFDKYKRHYVVKLDKPIEQLASKHHLRDSRRGLKNVTIDICENQNILEEWSNFYEHTIDRHNISGISAFTKNSFKQQLKMKESVVFRAKKNGNTIAMHWFLCRDEVVYSHLIGQNIEGYKVGASYALHYTAINYFKDNFNFLSLGGAADGQEKGLAKFKSGWTSLELPTYLCAKIVDHNSYRALSINSPTTDYFPSYRQQSV